MSKLPNISVFPMLGLVLCWAHLSSAAHPGLLLVPEDVALIRQSLDQSPSFAADLQAARRELERYFATFPDVPPPVDAGGGYSHETHKKNGIAIHDAGILHQLTGEAAYAEQARQLLLAYAGMYPGLGKHPRSRGDNPGRLFWQNLNESVWLTYAIQGFDAIHDTLPTADRERIEDKLLRPMADFLSEGSPGTFDRIHNHGTWAVAAVGMTGYALNDPDYVRKALYGLAGDGSSGFLRQIELLFSPDGYYGEGPYYQRYALMPFLLFARSIETNDPQLRIFQFRDGILLKAIYACIDLSYDGLFFPLNDAIKDKGLDTVELRHGVAIAYGLTGDAELLSIAGRQKSHVLSGDGFALARARDKGEALPFDFRSILLRDGPEGNRGGLAILRGADGANPRAAAAVLKATSQGMGHGHFDKLGLLFYDNGNEILTDYGAARFLNVAQKNGGRYLPENETWAKQSIAHNTLVADETSHFRAELGIAEQRHPQNLYFDSAGDVALAGATMADAYDEVSFNRTVALLPELGAGHPILIDLLEATGEDRHQFDLPVHFNGQIVDVSHPPASNAANLRPLGRADGYQHLWLRARAEVASGETFSITWLTGNRFYTYSLIAMNDMEVLFTELGANDPQFNLRREQALIFRVRDAERASFAAVLEPHGEYNAQEEFTLNSIGSITSMRHHSQAGRDALDLRTVDGARRILALSHDPDETKRHTIKLRGREYQWNGYYALFDAVPANER